MDFNLSARSGGITHLPRVPILWMIGNGLVQIKKVHQLVQNIQSSTNERMVKN